MKVSEVIVSGNALFHFRSYGQGGNSEMREKLRLNIGFLKIQMRQTSFYVYWGGHNELRKTKNKEEIPNV